MLDINTHQLCDLVQLYNLYEPALFRLHEGWSRYDNIFCVPVRKSTAIQEGYARLLYDLEHDTLSRHYVAYKYSALNPNCISRFGTLEFRHMGGTADTEEISKWINILLQLKQAIVTEATPWTDPDEVFGALHKELTIFPEDIAAGLEINDYILTMKEAL